MLPYVSRDFNDLFMIHAAILVGLIVFLEYNTCSVDRVLFKTDADTHSPADRPAVQ